MATAFLSSAIDSEERIKEGSFAPEIYLNDEKTETITKGKITLLNFWSPKDPESRIANNNFNNLFLDNISENFEFLSICVDNDEALAKEVIKYDEISTGRHYQLSEISEKSIKKYNALSNPATYLIDSDGKIISIGHGALSYLHNLTGS